MEYLIGTSGWHYEHWRGPFYPSGLAKTSWLEFYARHFPTVELNNSFYRLPSEKAFAAWRDLSPDGFVFAVKVSRLITHLKKLRGMEEPLHNFLTRARGLGPKLGPLLYQVPPYLNRHEALLEEFLACLPKDLRHVFEFRHSSWFHPQVFHLLEEYNAGFCVFNMPEVPCPVVATAPFAYVRFHGASSLYSSCYSDEELGEWAQKIAALGVAKAYVYFNNDAQAFAVRNALTLARMLGQTSPGSSPVPG